MGNRDPCRRQKHVSRPPVLQRFGFDRQGPVLPKPRWCFGSPQCPAPAPPPPPQLFFLRSRWRSPLPTAPLLLPPKISHLNQAAATPRQRELLVPRSPPLRNLPGPPGPLGRRSCRPSLALALLRAPRGHRPHRSHSYSVGCRPRPRPRSCCRHRLRRRAACPRLFRPLRPVDRRRPRRPARRRCGHLCRWGWTKTLTS